MANLSTAISNVKHLKAFDDLAKARLEALDLSVVMMYLIDSAPVDALPYLAEQFDVTGFNGWKLATTEADKRALIKKAIELKKHRGTDWAIIEAIKIVGFDNAVIRKAVGIDYDGDHNFDGSINYSGGHWAQFRVLITLPDSIGVSSTSLADVTQLILAYKNARSRLIDVSFRLEFGDSMPIDDQYLELADDEIIDNLGAGLDYDGFGTYDGGSFYNRLNDEFDLQIYNQFGELIG